MVAQNLSRSQLEAQKRANLAKIKEAQQILIKTRSQKNTSLAQVRALTDQITSQEQQIYLMEQDLSLISTEMQEMQAAIGTLEGKLVLLRKEYAEMLYRSSKLSGRLNQLSFILASSSFTELVMRYKYLRQYADNRTQHVQQIDKVRALLKEQQAALQTKKQSKEQIKLSKESEAKQLEVLKTQKAATVADLSKREKELRDDIAETQRSIRKLDNLISSIVSREITRRNKVAEAKKDNPTAEVAEVKIRGKAFGDNRRRLPWPVQSGIVSDRFGVKNHPVLANVKIDNNGIDIQTSSNATVRSVFEGLVMDISEIPGLGKVVTIQHGDYYTVYANLNEVFVSVDKTVATKETIGTANLKDGVHQINFQIWHKFQRLNPESWLAGR